MRGWFSKKPETGPRPVLDLLTFRTTIPSLPKDTPEPPDRALLKRLPEITKAALAKCRTDEEFLARSEPLVFSSDILESAMKLVREEPTASPEICAFVILYECFALVYNRSAQTAETFRTALQGIRIVDCKKLETEKCVCVGELIKNINQKQQNRDPEIISLLLDEFGHNAALDKEFYPRLLGVLKDAATSGKVDLVEKMKAVLFDILESGYQIIDFDKVHDLMVILQPFVTKLNSMILRILGFLSNRSEDHLLTDVFLQIPSSLVQVVSDQRQTKSFTRRQVTEPEYQVEEELKMEFMESGFVDEFANLPFEKLKETMTIWDLMRGPSRDAVASVLEFLKVCSSRARDVFVETSKHLILAVQGQEIYAELMACLIWLFQYSLDERLVDAILPDLSTTGIFYGIESIFHENGLDPVTNALRCGIFELLATRAPRLIAKLLGYFRKKPFVVAEFFVRVFCPGNNGKLSFDVELFCNDQSLKILFESVQILRNLQQSDATNQSLLSLFVVMNHMIVDYQFFRSQIFSNSFLWHMFDASLRNFVIITWRNQLSRTCNETEAVYPALYVRSVLQFCLQQRQEALPAELAEAMVDALKSNIKYSFLFKSCVPVLFDLAYETGNRSILICGLTLLVLVSFSPQFEWSLSVGKKVIDAIARIDRDEPLDDIRHLLFSLWARSFSYKLPFLIEQPMALTLILAVFGMSSRIHEILNIIESFMKYSYHNIEMVHEGLLDLMIVKYLNSTSNTVEVSKYLSFQLSADKEQCKRIFTDISLVKSSAAVVDSYIEGLDSPDKAELFVRLLAKAKIFGEKPQFPIGVMPHQFVVYGLRAEDFNYGFTIHFQLAIDPVRAALQKYNATIFTITDSQENELRVAFDREVVIGQVTADGLRTTVNIWKNLADKAVLDFILSFKITDELIRISTMMNGQCGNDSDLCAFRFADGEVKMIVGGIASTDVLEGAYSTCGVVSDITIYTGAHAPSLVRNESADVEDFVLLTSNEVKLPSVLPQRYFFARGAKGQKQWSAELVIQTQESMAAPYNLLRTAIRDDSINHLAKKVTVPGALSAMEFLFQIDESTQQKFYSLNVIVDQLSQIQLNYSIYLQLFHTMGCLTLKDLKLEWFEKLLFNLWLWKDCEPSELKLILNHWSAMLVNTYASICEEKRYLATLIHDLRLYFEVVVTDGQVNEDSQCLGGILGKRYNTDALRACRSLYVTVMWKLASISVTEADLSALFLHLRNCKCKEMSLCLINFLGSIADFFRPDAYYDDVISMLCGDPDIDEAIIIALCCLAKNSAYQRVLSVHSMVSGIELFEKLLSNLAEYPSLLPLLSIMSIKLQSYDKLLERVTHIVHMITMSVTENPDWFCYLFMIAFSIEDAKIEADVCRVVVMLMREDEMGRIGAFLNLVTYAAPSLRPEIVFTFLKECVNARRTATVWALCFDYSLFHFFTNSYHQFILDALKADGIVSAVERQPHPVVINSLNTLDDLKQLLGINTKDIHIRFELRLDESSNTWIDQDMANLAIKWVPQGDEFDKFVDVVTYFSRGAVMTPEARRAIQFDMDEFLQGQCQKYAADTGKILTELFTRLRNSLKFVGDHETRIVNSREEWEQTMKTEYARISKPMEIPTITFIRDNTACILYSPMKLKRHPNLMKRRTDIAKPNSPIYECQCMKVKKTGETKATFVLMRNCFTINGKPIPLNDVRIILTRKRANDETAIEIWTVYGKTLLIDFAPIKSSTVLKFFDKLEMKCLGAKQSQKANELFENCAFTFYWKKGGMSNFDYLMRMNILSGRSYNDKYLYPIFPAVTCQFNLDALAPMSFPSSDLLPTMNGTDTKSSIVSPEYYYLPSLFNNDYEFVYKHRKVLESEYVSKKLHVFIDRFFGCNMKNDFPHRKLFTKPHDHQVTPQFRCESAKTLHVLKDKRLVFATLTSILPADVEVNVLSDDGQSFLLNFKIDEQTTVTSQLVTQDLPSAKSVITSANKYVLLYDRSRFLATILMKGKVDRVVKIPSETDLATCYDFGWIFYCLNRTSIWQRTDGFLKALHHFPSPIRLIVANPAFKICVVATLDGTVSVYSVNQSLVKQAKFDEEITHIMITEKLGFIVVFTESLVGILDVSGELIKKVPFRYRVLRTFAFSSFSDFD